MFPQALHISSPTQLCSNHFVTAGPTCLRIIRDLRVVYCSIVSIVTLCLVGFCLLIIVLLIIVPVTHCFFVALHVTYLSLEAVLPIVQVSLTISLISLY